MVDVTVLRSVAAIARCDKSYPPVHSFVILGLFEPQNKRSPLAPRIRKGLCTADISNLQHSEAIKGLLGAFRIPDRSTAGDFLRRFQPEHLQAVQRVIDRAREKVGSQLPRSRRRVATIDLDSTIKPVYGEFKQGAEFSYNGQWSYHPLLITLMETNEPLRTINRSGNAASADGAAELAAAGGARRWHEVVPRRRPAAGGRPLEQRGVGSRYGIGPAKRRRLDAAAERSRQNLPPSTATALRRVRAVRRRSAKPSA